MLHILKKWSYGTPMGITIRGIGKNTLPVVTVYFEVQS